MKYRRKRILKKRKSRIRQRLRAPKRLYVRDLMLSWMFVFLCGLWLDGALYIKRFVTGAAPWNTFVFSKLSAIAATLYVFTILIWWLLFRKRDE